MLMTAFLGCSTDKTSETQTEGYGVGGQVVGLTTGTMVLDLNDEERWDVEQDGPFLFLTPLLPDDAYEVTLESVPEGIHCDLTNALGQMGSATVTDILVECRDRTYVSGVSYFGANDYIEYISGDLPVVLVAPHGGMLTPEGMPILHDHIGDGGSLEGMRITGEAMVDMTGGGRPHMIINHIASNRMIAVGTKDYAAGDHADARQAWKDFHGFILDAKEEVLLDWGKGHYFEFHTNGWPESWINIGVGVSAKHLNASDEVLRKRASLSTVRYLVEGEGADFLEILRGPTSLGGLLESRGYLVVPSPQIPRPGEGGFFYAGWNTWEHGSSDGGTMDATHIETHWQYINNGTEIREAYSRDLSESILVFMDTHYSGVSLQQP
jgi:hypothetical protein